MALIYVVEDDDNIREIETIALKNSNYLVKAFARATDFYRALNDILPDLVLMDVMLPDENGCDIVRRLRSQSATKYESSDGASNYRLGGFTTANIAFGFDFGGEKQYSVQAEVRNLFDKRYQYTEAILEPGLHANLKIGMKF